MPNLIPYVEFVPDEERLWVTVKKQTYLNIAPYSFNFTPIDWRVAPDGNCSKYGEWDDCGRFNGFTFDRSTSTLIVGDLIVTTHVKLGPNFAKILDLLFGPSKFYADGEAALFAKGPPLSYERMCELTDLIQPLIEEDTE
jgi:hypothetical protein